MKDILDLAGFSCPQIGIDNEILDVIIVGYARQVAETFLERFGTNLSHHTTGLSQLITAWLSQDKDESYEAFWTPALGDINSLLVSQSTEDVVRCAVALALRLNECGYAGDWRARLSTATCFRFGQCLVPATETIEVSATSEMVSVRTKGTDGWRSMIFNRQAERSWAVADISNIEFVPVCRDAGFEFMLSSAQVLSKSATERLLNVNGYQFKRSEITIRKEWLSTCESALNLIKGTSDIYVTWVDRVLQELIPLPARPHTFNSGSERFSPGVICVSDHPNHWILAENLVHEATHQYLHIINLLGPLDDGKDNKLYYSPFRNKDRPIFNILVAYHAFANVLLFYRTARESVMVSGELIDSVAFSNREKHLQRQLSVIEGTLQDTKSLTELGRSLWKPLYESLHA